MNRRNTIVAGNWKMNGTLAGLVGLSKGLESKLAGRSLSRARPVLFPPAPFLLAVAQRLPDCGVELGGQDCRAEMAGSFTGDISAPMLREIGCSFVIVGHSERRRFHAESNATVRAKAAAAMTHQLTPIICVGEDETGLTAGALDATLRRQVAESVPAPTGPFAIAYEPLWAIGAAASASTDHIGLAHTAIRAALVDELGAEIGDDVPILYGGSVNSANCADIFSVDNVGGVLVGRASMDADEFVALITAAENRRQRDHDGWRSSA